MEEFYWFTGIVVVCVLGAWLAVHFWEGGPTAPIADDDSGEGRFARSEFERAFREEERAARLQDGEKRGGGGAA